jgi:hypothetical protein
MFARLVLPLIDAYANTGQWSLALEVSQNVLQQTADLGNFLCAQWKRYAQLPGSADAALLARSSFGG